VYKRQQQAPSTTSLAASANPSTVGQPLTLTAGVASPGIGITGSISFLDGAVTIGSATLNASGVATFTTSSLSFGAHTLIAIYSGDTNHANSTSPALSEQIVQASTVGLTSSLNPSTTGINVVFTATATGVGSLIPTGSVTFSDGATPLATVSLNAAGSASFPTSALAVGSHTITASYTGDRNYSTAASSLVQTIQSANTNVTLTASANPAIYGTPLALTSTVSSNGGTATGNVTFTDGGATIGTAVLNLSLIHI